MNFHPPFFLRPLLSFFSYPANIEIIFDFSDIITKIHPPFQNPGSALEEGLEVARSQFEALKISLFLPCSL